MSTLICENECGVLCCFDDYSKMADTPLFNLLSGKAQRLQLLIHNFYFFLLLLPLAGHGRAGDLYRHSGAPPQHRHRLLEDELGVQRGGE